jgi:shikimate dehydrogenase
MTISGQARVAGIVGWPVTHSLSPRLHRHWLTQLGIDGAYVPLPARREDFSTVLDGLMGAGFVGVNVTVPYKQAAFAIAHESDAAAQQTGAANLLLFQSGGRIEARNTDVAGLAASLAEELGPGTLNGQTVVLLGAGGAARAAVLALAGLGVGEIRILSRNASRGQSLVAHLQPHVQTSLVPLPWTEWTGAARDTVLLVNATSAGMPGAGELDLPLADLPAGAAVYDLVYHPPQTALLKQTRARGLKAYNGLGMLMHQAMPAFAAFYRQTPAVTPALRAELEQALAS